MTDSPTQVPAASEAGRNEQILLERLRRGDEQAFVQWVNEQTPRLLSVARRYMSEESDAQDAVQDAFLSAFKSLPEFQGDSSLGTWLHTIVVRACLMKLRTRRRRPERLIEDLLPKFLDDGHRADIKAPWTVDVDELDHDETRQHVRRCIDELPQTHRTVLLLRDVEGLDTQETAALLGIEVNAVKTRLHRARLALRTLLAPHFEDRGEG